MLGGEYNIMKKFRFEFQHDDSVEALNTGQCVPIIGSKKKNHNITFIEDVKSTEVKSCEFCFWNIII